MKEVSKDCPPNCFDNSIEIEDFVYACETRPTKPAAFVEVGCGFPNDSENEPSGMEDIGD